MLNLLRIFVNCALVACLVSSSGSVSARPHGGEAKDPVDADGAGGGDDGDEDVEEDQNDEEDAEDAVKPTEGGSGAGGPGRRGVANGRGKGSAQKGRASASGRDPRPLVQGEVTGRVERVQEKDLMGFWFQVIGGKPHIWVFLPDNRVFASLGLDGGMMGVFQVRGRWIYVTLRAEDPREARLRLRAELVQVRRKDRPTGELMLALLVQPGPGRGAPYQMISMSPDRGRSLSGAYCAVKSGGSGSVSIFDHYRFVFNGAGQGTYQSSRDVTANLVGYGGPSVGMGRSSSRSPLRRLIYASLAAHGVVMGEDGEWGAGLQAVTRDAMGRVTSFKHEGRFFSPENCRLQ